MRSENVVIQTPFTTMRLVFESDVLMSVDFFTQEKLSSPVSLAAKKACQQIDAYCSKQLANLKFNIELQAEGTPFQQTVWRALQQIPAGQVMTYGQLAQQLNTSARAVGNACRANPIPLVIPCHRVVSKSSLGGFSGSRDGAPVEIKAWLLEHEGVSI
ncbi:MAG: MGMT family protein [Gammaproteobacteria bacterium]|nr:MGMT family protein [Gammaproteobacteria bacterium]